MLQIKSPVEGREAGGPQGVYWMSPQRDLALNFPVIVEKALTFCVELKTDSKVATYWNEYGEERGNTYLTEVAKALIAFVKETTQTPDIKVSDAYKKAGLATLNNDAYSLFCHAFTIVTFSAYFYSAREAAQGTFNPFILTDLRKIVTDG